LKYPKGIKQIKRELNLETVYHHNNNGNITYKSDAGDYIYDPNKPFAISVLQKNEADLPTALQEISYTPYHQPHEIE